MHKNQSRSFVATRGSSAVSGLLAHWKPRFVAGMTALLFAAGFGLAPRDALAALVTLDTTAFATTGATLEFTLFDGDGTFGNNSVTVSSLATVERVKNLSLLLRSSNTTKR